MAVTLVRYWGRALRSPQEAGHIARVFRRPAAAGWRSYLICAPPVVESAWLAPLAEANTEVVFIPRPPRNLHGNTVRRAFGLCQRVRADVFHCDNIHLSPLLGAWLARVPVRLWIKRSMEPFFEELRRPALLERLAPGVRLSCWMASRTATVSQAVYEQLAELGMPAWKLAVLDNPVVRWTPDPTARKPLRKALSYGEDEVVIGTVGRAAPVKGWDMLVRAFERVAAAAPEARLLLVGSVSGPDERALYEELSLFVEAHGLGDRVRFAGRRVDVADLLSAIDVFAMPSHSEGNANALNEAFGGGLPCVSTNVGNAPKLIRDDVSGLLVPRNDPVAMADALLTVVHDPVLRARLAKGAQASAVGPSDEEYLDRLFGIYLSLLEGFG